MWGPGGNEEPMSDAIRLLDIRDSALSSDEVLAAVADPTAGGTALFIGTVRNHDQDKPVTVSNANGKVRVVVVQDFHGYYLRLVEPILLPPGGGANGRSCWVDGH